MQPTLLALETSTHIGAVCLSAGGRVLARETATDAPKLSAWVVPAIERLLQQVRLGPDQLDAIAYGAGPGAFTGVRTACATAQALAYAWRKPLLAVDSLHALAAVIAPLCPRPGLLDILLDARMGELYTARFQLLADAPLPQPLGPTQLLNPADWAPAPGDQPHSLAGSGLPLLPAAATGWRPSPEQQAHCEQHWADGVAAVAAEQLRLGQQIDPLTAQPLYVRNQVAQTEAERARLRTATAAQPAA